MKVRRYSISQGICIDANPDRLVMEADYLRLARAAKAVLNRFYDVNAPVERQFDELIRLRDLLAFDEAI